MLYCARSSVGVVARSSLARSLHCTLVARAAAEGTRDRPVAKNQLCCVHLVLSPSFLSVPKEKAARTGNRNYEGRKVAGGRERSPSAMKGGQDLDPVAPVPSVNSPEEGGGGGGRGLLLPT